MNNTEKNILIAEFLGFQETSEGYFDNEGELEGVEKDNTFDFLKFHTDEKWLFKAAHKIMDRLHCEILVEDSVCNISDSEGNQDFIRIKGEDNHDALYLAIVYFIQLYNDSTQK